MTSKVDDMCSATFRSHDEARDAAEAAAAERRRISRAKRSDTRMATADRRTPAATPVRASTARAECLDPNRAALVARWYALTRELLPLMAGAQRWPIRLDHCFMRVCLDAALGSPWTGAIERPAVRTASDAQLRAAIAVAEAIVADPATLPALNEASLRGRRAARAS